MVNFFAFDVAPNEHVLWAKETPFHRIDLGLVIGKSAADCVFSAIRRCRRPCFLLFPLFQLPILCEQKADQLPVSLCVADFVIICQKTRTQIGTNTALWSAFSPSPISFVNIERDMDLSPDIPIWYELLKSIRVALSSK